MEKHSTRTNDGKNDSAGTKDKEEDSIPPLPKDWELRCHAYLERKRRYCRQMKNPGSVYCGNHQELETTTTTTKKRKRRRVPCPLDGSHSIFEEDVARHIKICPMIKKQQQQEAQDYYSRNINAGGHGDGGDTTTTSHQSEAANRHDNNINITHHDNNSSSTGVSMDQAKALAEQVLIVHQRLFVYKSNFEEAALKETNVSNILLQDIESQLPLKDFSKGELELGLEKAIESYNIRSGGPKHLHQQASLLGHMRNKLQVAPNKNCIKKGQRSEHASGGTNGNDKGNDILILELGAGRGMLGLLAASAIAADNNDADVDLVMIERAGTRSKADTILRNHKSSLEDRCLKVEKVRHWQRIRCDLAHVRLETVVAKDDRHNKNEKTIVVVAKHLCGAGTDLALKALRPIRNQVKVCLMATCCHGVCSWKDYVGRDYLKEALLSSITNISGEQKSDGLSFFGQEEFDLLRLWSSGTVACDSCCRKKTINSNNKKKNKQQEATSNSATESSRTGHEDRNEKHAYHCIPSQSSSSKLVTATTVARELNLACGVHGLGRACQRLIDHGRKEYVRKVLFGADTETDLFYYVPSSVTPQNAALVAFQSSSSLQLS